MFLVNYCGSKGLIMLLLYMDCTVLHYSQLLLYPARPDGYHMYIE